MRNENKEKRVMNTKSKTVPFYRVIVIGGGFAGLGAAIKLKQAGIHDFILLEKANELGGVWRENTYPGCGCDVPSALYSYSFAPSSKWSHLFARQPEILSYLEEVSHTFNVHEKIEFEIEFRPFQIDKKKRSDDDDFLVSFGFFRKTLFRRKINIEKIVDQNECLRNNYFAQLD